MVTAGADWVIDLSNIRVRPHSSYRRERWLLVVSGNNALECVGGAGAFRAARTSWNGHAMGHVHTVYLAFWRGPLTLGFVPTNLR